VAEHAPNLLSRCVQVHVFGYDDAPHGHVEVRTQGHAAEHEPAVTNT
jgi:hypothetical protein